MRKIKQIPKQLMKQVDYRDGKLFWKEESFGRNPYKSAGNINNLTGYINIHFTEKGKGSFYRVHRVVWTMFKGEIPEGYQVDHINRNKLDNRIENLRLLTNRQNCVNSPSRKNSSSRFKGVSIIKGSGKFRGCICTDNKSIHIGTFDTEEEAAKAYNEKAKELFGEFAYLNEL